MRRHLWTLILTAAAAQPAAIELPGLKEPAEILVDRWGVPHIYARNFDDAFFVQGFNAARDRLFQIDLWRRRGLGQLSAVFGPKFIEQDKAARLFLYRGDAAREWASYGPQAQRMATAFAAGINAYVDWLATHPERLPIEFRTLKYEPARWDAFDVVRIRSHGLTGNLTAEVARANTACKAGPGGADYDQFRVRLAPKHEIRVPEGLDPCLPPGVLRNFTLATQAVNFAGSITGADDGGSNNWVIGPAKSATGRVVLASDPHRAYSTPSLRYIAHLSAPGLDVIGGGEPSLPGVSIGHNGTAAFALTRFYIDQQDLYVYELNPDNPRQYRYRGGWEDMRVLNESIAVKGAPAVAAALVFTRHGPVIYADQKRAFAVRSCWLEPGTAAYFGSASYMTARNPAEFRSGVGRALAPGLNFVYGDSKGQIGWVVGGLSPVRRNWDGLLPVPGDGRYEWDGFLPSAQLPFMMNPAPGFFSNSNEMNLPEGYPHQLGYDWANPSRHQRIESVLRAKAKLTFEDSLRLQTDVVSLPGRRLAALLAPLRSEDPQTRAALELLKGWDGEESVTSAPAALYEVWTSRHLGRAFLDASLPPTAASAIRAADMGMMLDTLETGKHRDLLLRTLRAAYEETQRLLGPDSTRWQWGKLSQSLPPHPLLGFVDEGLRAKLQVGPFPRAGGPHTPNMSQYRSSDFRLIGGPSLRVMIDVGQWDNSRAVNHPGQSGDPESPHYRDLAPLWSQGTYFPLLYSRAAVEKEVRERIVLTPRRRVPSN